MILGKTPEEVIMNWVKILSILTCALAFTIIFETIAYFNLQKTVYEGCRLTCEEQKIVRDCPAQCYTFYTNAARQHDVYYLLGGIHDGRIYLGDNDS